LTSPRTPPRGLDLSEAEDLLRSTEDTGIRLPSGEPVTRALLVGSPRIMATRIQDVAAAPSVPSKHAGPGPGHELGVTWLGSNRSGAGGCPSRQSSAIKIASLIVPVLLQIPAAGCEPKLNFEKMWDSGPNPGSAVIGPAGGSVYLLIGPTISIPPGALANEVSVSLDVSGMMGVDGYEAVSWEYSVTPNGLRLSKPATVNFLTYADDAGKVTVYWSPDGMPDTYQDIGGTREGQQFISHLDVFGSIFLGRTCATRSLHCGSFTPYCSGPSSLETPTGACSAGRCTWMTSSCPAGCSAGACR
jgi:hypothetical protein